MRNINFLNYIGIHFQFSDSVFIIACLQSYTDDQANKNIDECCAIDSEVTDQQQKLAKTITVVIKK